jgi:hypothetical protein
MIALVKVAVKSFGALGFVILLCSVTLTRGRAAGHDMQQQGSGDLKAEDKTCTDIPLKNIGEINFEAIGATIDEAIKQGKNWIPCDAKQESDPKSDTPAQALQRGFDYYSWLTFIALNSPHGGFLGTGTPVWQTYKQLPDVMLADGRRPSDWSDSNQPVIPDPCANKKGMIIHMEMEETYNEPFKTGPLFDQNGNYALFVIFMNKQMFGYIRDNNLYNREGQEIFQAKQMEVDFPEGNIGLGSLGAVMVKVSWKLMKEGVDFGPNITPKYHIIDGLLYRPKQKGEDACRQVKLGLIGFHVGHKTASRQQWIWTTFEHHENVPTEEDVDNHKAAGPYSFYDPTCKLSECPVNQVPEGPWDPDTLGWAPFPKNHTFKSQIVRTGPSSAKLFQDDDVAVLNKLFHNWPRIKGTVWENYDLITTQWPSGFPCSFKKHPGNLPDPTCTPFPMFLANSTLETFSQAHSNTIKLDPDAPDVRNGIPLATSSCISCHNNATTNPTHHDPKTIAMRSDFTYILEKACSVNKEENHLRENCTHD